MSDSRSYQHTDLLLAMEAAGFNVDSRGMCHGFAMAAADYYCVGKLSEFDDIIALLHGLINEINEGLFQDDLYSPGEFKRQFKDRLTTLDASAVEQINTLFKKIASYQENQLDTHHPIKTVGMYNEENMFVYLRSLQEEIDSNSSSLPGAALLMQSNEHTIMVTLEPLAPMALRDINKPNTLMLPMDDIYQAREIIQSLALSDPQCEYVFSETDIHVPESNQSLVAIVSNWQKSELCQSLHEISPEKISIVGGDGGSLLLHAVRVNDIDLIKKMFLEYPDLENQPQATKALLYAIILQHKNSIAFLLEKNIDCNLIVASKTHHYAVVPLECAIQYKDIDTAKAILSKEGITTSKICTLESEWISAEAKLRGCENSVTELFKHAGIDISANENTTIELPLLYMAAFLGQTEIVDKLLQNSETEIVYSSSTISPDQLAYAMNYNQTGKMIHDYYKKTIKEWLFDIGDSSNKMSSDVRQFLITNNVIDKLSLVECEKAMQVFQGLMELENKLLTVNDDYFLSQIKQLYHDYEKEIVKGNLEDTINGMEHLDKKLNLFVTTTSLVENKNRTETFSSQNDIKFSALQKMQRLICSELPNNQVEKAYTIFEKIVNLENRLSEQKNSKFFNKVDPAWYMLLNDFYSYFTAKEDNDFSVLNEKLNHFSKIEPAKLGFSLTKEPQGIFLIDSPAISQANQVHKKH